VGKNIVNKFKETISGFTLVSGAVLIWLAIPLYAYLYSKIFDLLKIFDIFEGLFFIPAIAILILCYLTPLFISNLYKDFFKKRKEIKTVIQNGNLTQESFTETKENVSRRKDNLLSEYWSLITHLDEKYGLSTPYDEVEIDFISSNEDFSKDLDNGIYFYFDDTKYHKIINYFSRETSEVRDGKQTTYVGYEYTLHCEISSEDYRYCRKEHIQEGINLEQIDKKMICKKCFEFLFLEEE